jgi:putative transposase
MTKRAFRMILERQRQSGLTIMEFCRNESYNPASFHHWKSKFGFTNPRDVSGMETNSHTEEFAPVRFPIAPMQTAPSAAVEAEGTEDIMLELPFGIKIHFSGRFGTRAAIGFITQMYSSHVLPQ